jgi:hypothetical protein
VLACCIVTLTHSHTLRGKCRRAEEVCDAPLSLGGTAVCCSGSFVLLLLLALHLCVSMCMYLCMCVCVHAHIFVHCT